MICSFVYQLLIGVAVVMFAGASLRGSEQPISVSTINGSTPCIGGRRDSDD